MMRRMLLNKVEGYDDYARYLSAHPEEVQNLYQDILINVTSFFRHPETFELLKKKMFPQIIERRPNDDPVRVWVLGCSTGEEAYSIAMTFAEFASERSDHVPVQIFATDVNERGIEKARAGLIVPERAARAAAEDSNVQQIVWNLLSNAVKFTPKGGKIEIRLERESDGVKIVVKDTGIGIRREFLPHVFDLFRQADSRTNRSFGGLGLGLAIVRNLTALHGGAVRAASAGAGKGSTFEVMLPPKPPASESIDEAETGLNLDDGDLQSIPEGARPLEGARVLVVDDDSDSREMLNAALTAYGAEVRTCASSREALTTLKKWLPDFLLSDIGMPGEDGYNLIQHIRELPLELGGNIPALALTGYATLGDHHRALEAGYQMHLAKPVELGRLAAMAARLLERSRAPRSAEPSKTTQTPEL